VDDDARVLAAVSSLAGCWIAGHGPETGAPARVPLADRACTRANALYSWSDSTRPMRRHDRPVHISAFRI